MPTPADSLIAIRDDLIAVVAAQTAAWRTAGCPPVFSIDGESYNWLEWLRTMTEQIKSLTEQIAVIAGPFVLASGGRA